MFCNVRFELRLGIFWFFLKQIVLKSDLFLTPPPPPEKIGPPLSKCLDPPLITHCWSSLSKEINVKIQAHETGEFHWAESLGYEYCQYSQGFIEWFLNNAEIL